MFLSLYKSNNRPHLRYATVVWSQQFKKDIILLENIQRRATRLVNSAKRLGYADRLKVLGLPTLEYRREQADMIQMYKIINNIDYVDQDKFFTMSLNRTTRGHSKKIFKNRYRLNVRANSFSNRIGNTWNSLTESDVSAPSLNAVKSRLNQCWKGHPYKFEAACYSAHTTTTRRDQYRDTSEEAGGLHIDA